MDTVIQLRVKPEEKRALTDAARAVGLSLSAFLREASLRSAQKVLREFKLSPVKQNG